MAEPDHGTDSGITPDDPSSTGSAPAQGSTSADSSTPAADSGTPAVDDAVDGGVTDTPDATTPVVRKSAPLRRHKSKSSTAASSSDPKEPTPPTDSEPVAEAGDEDTGTGDVGTGDVGSGDTDNEAATAEIAPDPSEVERSVGYRQRRQGGGPAPQPGVTYSSSKTAAASSGWVITGALATVVLVVGIALAAVFAVGTHRYDTQNELRAEYSSFAQQMIVNLTTLNKDNVDQALKTLEDKTSGKAKQQMQDSMKQAAGLIAEQNLNTKTTILSDAVTKADPDEGSVMVVYGWQMDPVEKGEEMTVQTFRWRVDITRINGDLKMTNFEWVT